MMTSLEANSYVQILPLFTSHPSVSNEVGEFNQLNKDELNEIFDEYRKSHGPIACRCDSTSVSMMERLIVPISLMALALASPVGAVNAQNAKAYVSVVRSTTSVLAYDHVVTSNEYLDDFSFNIEWLLDIENMQVSNVDHALDLLYDRVDNLLMFQRYFEVDWLLNEIDISKFSVTVLLGFLSVTFFYRNHLKTRKTFYGKIKRHIQQIDGYSEALLFGLES